MSPEHLFIGGAAAVAGLSVLILTLSGREKSEAGKAAGRPDGENRALWGAFRSGLAKARRSFGASLEALLGRNGTLETRLEALEESLIAADVGVATAQKLIAGLRRRSGLDSPDALVAALKSEIRGVLVQPAEGGARALPRVIVVAGVNGVGKTTSIAKLAHLFQCQGKKVLLVAADTFRAAAIEQIEVWAERIGCDLVKHQAGADPSAVAYDGVRAASSRGVDVVIIDTAGRLHVRTNLMEELKKVVRVIGRELPGAPHEVYLVLDATTGQNALNQTRQFSEAIPLTGVILTKLDGTAKGGSVLAVRSELSLPIRYVGLGEGLGDLQPFDPDAFVEALFGD